MFQFVRLSSRRIDQISTARSPSRRGRARIDVLERRRLLSGTLLQDGSFEGVMVAANAAEYNPPGSAWTFISTAGLIRSPSSFNAPAAPNGGQVAFVQTNRGASQYNGSQDGTLSQSVTLPSSGYYTLSFDAAADASDTGGSVAAEESVMATLDGVPALTGLHPSSSAFSLVSGTFYAGAGNHTLALVATGPSSTTTFLDQVQLSASTAGPASQLVFTTVGQSLTSGTASSAITVQLEDAAGLAVPTGAGGVSVSLSTSSNAGLFLRAGVATTAVTVPAGSNNATFAYKDMGVGTPTITAAAAGLTAATQQESVEAVTASSFLRASGTSIVNGSGKTVQLRGVNLGSWLTMEGWMSPLDSSGLPDEYGVIQTLDNRFGVAQEQSLLKTYQQNWITLSDLQNIKADGFNTIRVPIWWGDFETLQGQWRSDAFQQLDWLVNAAGAMGIYTIIDMHGPVGGDSASDDTGRANLDNYWTSTYDQQQTNLLMQNIALHYKNNPTVAGYDLLNEPDNAPSDSAVIAAYDRLYTAVHAVDSNHIDFFEGCFDQWNWSMLPTPASQGWTNVVYEMHEYQFGDTNNPGGVEAGTDNQVSDFQDHAYENVPDYVGEFNDFGTSSSWQYTFQQYDAHNISWSFWSYKAIDGTVGGQDSWGLYDPISIPMSPNIQTDSVARITSDWTRITTAGYFAVNPLIQNALTSAGVVPTATGVTLMADGPTTSNASQSLTFTATLTGGVPNGAAVTLEDASNNNAPVAIATVAGGFATFTLPAGALAAGTHSLFAAYAGSDTYAPSNSNNLTQTVQLVVTSTTINGNLAGLAGVQRSMIESIVYSFSEPVNIGANAFSIALHPGQTGTVPTLTWTALSPAADGSSASWVVTFSGAGVVGMSIADGVYDLSLNAPAVTADSNPAVTAQTPATFTFDRLFGDINGDGVVNLGDYGRLAKAFGTSVGNANYIAALDYDGNGTINLGDYGQLIKRFS